VRVSVEPAAVRVLKSMARTFVVGVASIGVAVPAAAASGKRAVPQLRRDVEARLAAAAPSITKMKLAVHVTMRDGRPVGDLLAFEQSLERANELLQPHGIEVEVVRVDTVPVDARVYGLHARRHLARYAPPGRIVHVFIVESLERELPMRIGNPIRGLYWRAAGLGWIRGRHWISVSNAAPRSTLAHELGHLLGLRHHRGERNVMCSCRRGSGIRFLPVQGVRMRSHARVLVEDPDAAQNWALYRRRLHRLDR
jgi:hypothetical protein